MCKTVATGVIPRQMSGMAVTLTDVAKRAGVSKSAVSRTFTPGASVSAKTRAKVEAAATALGYRPNVLASSLTTGRTKLIGLVSNNFTNPYFLEIFDLLTRNLQSLGLRPLLVNLHDEDDPAGALGMLRQYSVDGAIIASSTLPPSFASAFVEAGLPVIHAFGWSSSSPLTDFVGINNVESGRLAAQTLAARGYGKVGFLGGPEGASTSQDRLAGLRSFGPLTTVAFADAYSFAAGRAAMATLIEQGNLCEAYFCGDDVIALGAISAARDAGLAIPDDVGFLGLNDMDVAGWPGMDLTTLRQPMAEIIEGSVRLITQRIADPERAAEQVLLPCTLIERGSLRSRA